MAPPALNMTSSSSTVATVAKSLQLRNSVRAPDNPVLTWAQRTEAEFRSVVHVSS